MKEEKKDKLYELLNRIKVTKDNKQDIKEIREAIDKKDLNVALEKLQILSKKNKENQQNEETETRRKEREQIAEKIQQILESNPDFKEQEKTYPVQLRNLKLEYTYISVILNNIKSISMYYFLHDDCFFESDDLLKVYRSILYTEGEAFAPEIAKKEFTIYMKNDIVELKKQLLKYTEYENFSIEKLYIELRKIFLLRNNYMKMPIKEMQDKLVEIVNYELYDMMTIEEVESAINQIIVTSKFKQSILNSNVTDFLLEGDNNLTNGLALPFPILSSVFKGIRKGETMSLAMPSNSGKSRLTIDIAAYIAFIHKQKVLIISNEMSEEKMKLCLITTILNNPEIQKMHKQKLKKTEGEILEFKFRPNSGVNASLDENGFIVREPKETKEDYVKRLSEISDEFKATVAATDWLNKEMNNSIYFINITDHTNDELKKVIMNYYYKEKIEYIFYDTLKTDTANIGNGEEIKKTATILSNLAQDFTMFIGSTLQLMESTTLPINLNINDLAVSRTVKEVLDTLCLFKQIHNEDLKDYEYSLKEVDTQYFDLQRYTDPDVRYYACVVDKNRAGAKPKLLFRLNLAYNIWEELGYLRLKNRTDEN